MPSRSGTTGPQDPRDRMSRWLDYAIVASLVAIALAVVLGCRYIGAQVIELSERTTMVQCECR